MNRRLATACMAIIVAGLLGASALAQAPVTKVGFDFFAFGHPHQSGKYVIELTPAGKVSIRTEKGKEAAEMAPLKTLGKDDSVKFTKLVFAVVGSERILTEVWLPGQEGCLVASVSGEHEQKVLGGTREAR
jgi:hypothetical protein